jgi:hypothetical protein
VSCEERRARAEARVFPDILLARGRFPKTGRLKIRRVGLFRRLDAWWTTVSEARETATASRASVERISKTRLRESSLARAHFDLQRR